MCLLQEDSNIHGISTARKHLLCRARNRERLGEYVLAVK